MTKKPGEGRWRVPNGQPSGKERVTEDNEGKQKASAKCHRTKPTGSWSTEAILQELRVKPKIKKTQKTIWHCHRDRKRELNQHISLSTWNPVKCLKFCSWIPKSALHKKGLSLPHGWNYLYKLWKTKWRLLVIQKLYLTYSTLWALWRQGRKLSCSIYT